MVQCISAKPRICKNVGTSIEEVLHRNTLLVINQLRLFTTRCIRHVKKRCYVNMI